MENKLKNSFSFLVALLLYQTFKLCIHQATQVIPLFHEHFFGVYDSPTSLISIFFCLLRNNNSKQTIRNKSIYDGSWELAMLPGS